MFKRIAEMAGGWGYVYLPRAVIEHVANPKAVIPSCAMKSPISSLKLRTFSVFQLPWISTNWHLRLVLYASILLTIFAPGLFFPEMGSGPASKIAEKHADQESVSRNENENPSGSEATPGVAGAKRQ